MSSEFTDKNDIRDEIDRVGDMEDSAEKIYLLEELIRTSERMNWEYEAFLARVEMFDSMQGLGMGAKYLAHFPKVINYALKLNDNDYTIWALARYRIIMYDLKTNYSFTREQCEQVLDEMETHYKQFNFPEKSIVDERFKFALEIGEKEEAIRLFQKSKSLPPIPAKIRKTYFTQCNACDIDLEIHYYNYIGEIQKAWELADPIVEGKLRCSTVPRYTFAELTLTLVRLGMFFDADRIFELARAAQDHEFHDPEGQSKLIRYCAIRGKIMEGILLAEEFYPEAREIFDKRDEFLFSLAMWIMVVRLEKHGNKRWEFNFGDEGLGVMPEEGFEIGKLKDFFWNKAKNHGDKFDARNKTSLFSDRMKEAAALAEEFILK